MNNINKISGGLLALGLIMFIIDRIVTPDPYYVTVWGDIGVNSWIAAFIISVGSLFIKTGK